MSKIFFTAGLLGFVPCRAQHSSISKLRLINEYIIPFNQPFKSTVIGGLSGIDRDQTKDLYYILSDDRSDINPVRFYTAKIRISSKGIDTVVFEEVHFILQSNGKKIPSFKMHPRQSVDPEDIRFNAKTKELFWTSEGERILKNNEAPVLINPSIGIVKLDGSHAGSFPLPSNIDSHSSENGSRRNGALESLSFSDDFTTLYTAIEEPLYEDGPRAAVEETDSWIRIYQFDVASKKNLAQYAYKLEPVAHPSVPVTAFKINGVSAILSINSTQLLTVERSYSTGRLPCTIKVFLADFSEAENIKDAASLIEHKPSHPVKKQLLLNLDDLGIHIDNVEGVTLGPKLSNGHSTLLFVTDDNFQQNQKTQLLLFEVLP